jgi:hypothetical protein
LSKITGTEVINTFATRERLIGAVLALLEIAPTTEVIFVTLPWIPANPNGKAGPKAGANGRRQATVIRNAGSGNMWVDRGWHVGSNV